MGRPRYNHYYDDEEPDECGGHEAGCTGCSDCEETSITESYHVARKTRGHGETVILPGDLVKRTGGFSYQKDGGPRTGYFRHTTRSGKGPAHGPNTMGFGWYKHCSRGSFSTIHPDFAELVQERDAFRLQVSNLTREAKGDINAWEMAVEAWEDKYDTTWEWRIPAKYGSPEQTWNRQAVINAYHAKVQEKQEAERMTQARKAWSTMLCLYAKHGDIVVHPDGTAYRYQGSSTRLQHDRNIPHWAEGEYAEAFGVYCLTNLKTGKYTEIRCSRA